MPLLIANWKQNNLWDDCEQFAAALLQSCPQYTDDSAEAQLPELIVCPALPYLSLVGKLFKHSQVFLGAQDVSRFDSGAYTGEVSARMLADSGCDYCIVGHSERRHVMGESDALLAEKLTRLHAAEIVPVLCVGEPLSEREAGRAAAYTLAQLDALREPLAQCEPGGLVVAYEPVWAIGTGRNAEPSDAEELATAIQRWLATALGDDIAGATPVLYGGSVKPENIAAYLALPSIGGALVGGASLTATSFAALVEAYRGVLANGAQNNR